MHLTRLIVGATLVVLLAASMPGARTARAQNAAVGVANFAFSPAEVTITAGASVTWTVNGGTHTVSGSFASSPGPLRAGQTHTATFATAGTFAYRCEIHPDSMKGTVVVRAAQQATATQAPPAATGTIPPTPAPLSPAAAATAAPAATAAAGPDAYDYGVTGTQTVSSHAAAGDDGDADGDEGDSTGKTLSIVLGALAVTAAVAVGGGLLYRRRGR